MVLTGCNRSECPWRRSTHHDCARWPKPGNRNPEGIVPSCNQGTRSNPHKAVRVHRTARCARRQRRPNCRCSLSDRASPQWPMVLRGEDRPPSCTPAGPQCSFLKCDETVGRHDGSALAHDRASFSSRPSSPTMHVSASDAWPGWDIVYWTVMATNASTDRLAAVIVSRNSAEDPDRNRLFGNGKAHWRIDVLTSDCSGPRLEITCELRRADQPIISAIRHR